MKRTILFKGKRVDNGEWVKGYYVKAEKLDGSGFEHFIIEESKDGATHKIIPETLCEFTGLTDKNGTKIFEGDIHEYQNHFFIVRYGKYRDCETLEDVYGWYFEYTHSQDCEGFSGNEKEYINIIGNIFDNKELLQ